MLRKSLHVNIPFTMLQGPYLRIFVTQRLNPEIGFDATALDRTEWAQFTTVADQIRAAGLSVTFHAPFVDLSPGSPDPKIRSTTMERLKQVLELIPLFQPRTVVCHAAYDDRRYRFMRKAWLESSVDTWSWFGEKAREFGSILVLENVYEQGPEEIASLLERLLPVGAGFCFDVGHHSAFGRETMETWIHVLGDFLGQLHLHDNHGAQDEHLALGEGAVDFEHLLRLLAEKDNRFLRVTLEPHREQDVRPSLEYLEKVWPQ